jgi:hypothetical protein
MSLNSRSSWRRRSGRRTPASRDCLATKGIAGASADGAIASATNNALGQRESVPAVAAQPNTSAFDEARAAFAEIDVRKFTPEHANQTGRSAAAALQLANG